MPDSTSQLPVESILSELERSLVASGTVILQAPPGSGKTTRVPLALLNNEWLAGGRILMLEPRRLAATNAARYMSNLCSEQVGETVGYAIRYERRIGPGTRLEVMTEGLLIRRLQNDPELTGVGLVIFDEFHERSLQADLALALCRDVQQGLRQDLRILIMSATLDAAPLSRLLGNCPVISTDGRSHPVNIRHLPDAERNKIAENTARGVRIALQETGGDILAFLPGRGEIHRCQVLLGDLSRHIALRPLYGGLPFADQETAILPGDRRRVVLATNVAETSLTIEGIETVVDCGWERRPRFDAARGMTRLETIRISRASAEQRAGRAGRLGPGHCYRLWSEGTHGALLPFAPPEISQADLAPLAFELAQWGVHKVNDLDWLEVPPEGHMSAARRLLVELGAINKGGNQLTPLGKEMSRYPAHPRLARLLVTAVNENSAGLGSDLVALLDERDLLAAKAKSSIRAADSSDFIERLELLHGTRSSHLAPVQRAASFWRKLTGAGKETTSDPTNIGRLLVCAYPDRIALNRESGSRRYLLRNGQGAKLAATSAVREAEWLVAVETAGRSGGEDEIRLASALSRKTIEELFGRDIEWRREAGWDDQAHRVVTREVRRLGAILLQERPVKATPEDTLPALFDLIRRQGLEILPWTQGTRQLQARANFLHQHLADQGWPNCSDAALMNSLEDWLSGWLSTTKNRDDLKRIDLAAALKTRLGWEKLKELEQLAPERLEVPTGSRIRLDYATDGVAVLAVKLQEMFGVAATPRLVKGQVPILIHLLSPAGRPLAVTRDLKSFWDNVYPEVQKEMKGRYPKHPWPDDPWKAKATKKTRGRSENRKD